MTLSCGMFFRGKKKPSASCTRSAGKAFGGQFVKLVSASLQAADVGKQWMKDLFKHEEPQYQIVDDFQDQEPDPLEKFAPVLANLVAERIQDYASYIRRSRIGFKQYEVTPWSFECTMSLKPLYGSYNILFRLIFGDNVEWVLKVPSAGHAECWDDMAARTLRTEVSTMRFLRRSGLPIPAVYSFDASMDNALGCPFILMEYIDGRPLYDGKSSLLSTLWWGLERRTPLTRLTGRHVLQVSVFSADLGKIIGWLNDTMSKETQEQFRQRTLQTLAVSMTQLGGLRFSRAGSLVYDENNKRCTFGPTRVTDFVAMSNRYSKWALKTEEPDDEDLFCELGPFNNEAHYFQSKLDRHRWPEDKFGQGLYNLLQLFVRWLPQDISENPFVISHPDLDLQNVLVDKSGAVVGIIDWDGVATVPRSIGCGYPLWLTCGWDPLSYAHRSGSGQPDLDHNRRIPTPKELKHYRKMYTRFLEELAAAACDNIADPSYLDTVRKSPLMESLETAINDPLATTHTVIKIFKMIAQITAQKDIRVESGLETQAGPIQKLPSPVSHHRQLDNTTTTDKHASSATVSDVSDSDSDKQSRITRKSTPRTDISSRASKKSNIVPSHSEAGGALTACKDAKKPPATEIATKSTSKFGSASVGNPSKKSNEARFPFALQKFSRLVGSRLSRSGDAEARNEGSTGQFANVHDTVTEVVSLPFAVSCHQVEDSPGNGQADEAIADDVISRNATPSIGSHSPELTGALNKVTSSMEVATSNLRRDPSAGQTSNLEHTKVQITDATGADLGSLSESAGGVRHTVKGREDGDETDAITCEKPDKSTTATMPTDKAIQPHHGWRLEERQPKDHSDKATELGTTTDKENREASATTNPNRKTKEQRRRRKLVKKRKLQRDHHSGQTMEDACSSLPSREKRITTWLMAVARKTRLKDNTPSSNASSIYSTQNSEEETSTQEGPNSTSLADERDNKSAAMTTPGPQRFDLGNLELIDNDQLWEENFLAAQVFKDLADGTLDDARMQRLKTGFQVLLNSL